jgi:hypothetical protein
MIALSSEERVEPLRNQSLILFALMVTFGALDAPPAFAAEPACAPSGPAAQPLAVVPQRPPMTFTDAGQLVAYLQRGRPDVPRLELAAQLAVAGFAATDQYRQARENTARELAGRPDGAGAVSAEELRNADSAIAREIDMLRGTAPPPSFAALAKSSGRPQIDGLTIVYLNPLGDPARANPWQNILVHQTEGPPGSAHREATDQFANPTKRGVMLWVETDGTVYWSVAETVITTQGEGGDRNDNKYIDNAKTYHQVVKTNSIGVEFAGNYPDVAKPTTPAQAQAWLVLVRFLQERYGIPPDNIYAHNWIDFKDQRYCEGCDLATLARRLGYCPSHGFQ